jgi:hypothetical protein
VSVDHVAIVGAGIAGLAAAAELSSQRPVTVLDRLPVAGGVRGYEAPAVRMLVERCRGTAVRWMLGVTAVRWDDRRLLTVGPNGVRWLQFDHLFYAGGSRPATQAELRITGPRVAGVLPATVALHFAEAGVVLGRRVAIIGSGDWANAVGKVIAEQDCEIVVVAPDDTPAPSFRHDALISGWSAARVTGSARVEALFLERSRIQHRLSCDAVILAAAPRALRNVDGAVFDPSGGVTFVQPVADHASESWVAAKAAEAARRLAAQPPIEVRV